MNTRRNLYEDKDKRRGRRLSIIIHIILLLLLFITLPLKKDEDPTFKKAIIVEFNSGSKSEGARPASDSPSENVKKERAKPVEVIQPSTTVKPQPPIETSEKEPPIVPPQVKKVEVKVDEPIEELPDEVEPEIKKIPEPVQEKPKPNVPKIKIREIVKILEADIEREESTEGGNGSGAGEGNANKGTSSENKGTESGTGKGDAGDGKGDSGQGTGREGRGGGSDFGDGILDRRIIQQPSLTDIIKEEGVLAFNVCVNQQGRVVFGEYNSRVSTIRNKSVVSKALERVNQYLFESDYSAPKRECGVVRIVFEFDF
jgi:outer membrane biosynthesis protein TonB